MSDLSDFEAAKTAAEGRRQTAISVSEREWKGRKADLGAAAIQRDQKHTAAVRAAEVEYFESVIAACARYGIHDGPYRRALRELGGPTDVLTSGRL